MFSYLFFREQKKIVQYFFPLFLKLLLQLHEKKETFLFFSTLKLLRQKASHNNIIDGAGGDGGKPFL